MQYVFRAVPKIKTVTLNSQFIEQVSMSTFSLSDLNRTFPDNILFSETSRPCLQKPLYNVLLAYGHHNSTVGYCQVTLQHSTPNLEISHIEQLYQWPLRSTLILCNLMQLQIWLPDQYFFFFFFFQNCEGEKIDNIFLSRSNDYVILAIQCLYLSRIKRYLYCPE